MIGRAAFVAALVVVMKLYTAHANVDSPPLRVPLAHVPLRIGEWQGRNDEAFPTESAEAAGVDDYIARVYARPSAHAVALYIGYYASQRQGDTIHSPQNCLPGAGWEPVSSTRRSFSTTERRVEANDIVIQKGLDRAVVLYWYQGRGRTIASEYANKLWLMLDAARLHRTDGALVRVMAPVAGDPGRAESDAAAFAAALVPQLREELP